LMGTNGSAIDHLDVTIRRGCDGIHLRSLTPVSTISRSGCSRWRANLSGREDRATTRQIAAPGASRSVQADHRREGHLTVCFAVAVRSHVTRSQSGRIGSSRR
jgi:hypothetical protein